VLAQLLCQLLSMRDMLIAWRDARFGVAPERPLCEPSIVMHKEKAAGQNLAQRYFMSQVKLRTLMLQFACRQLATY